MKRLALAVVLLALAGAPPMVRGVSAAEHEGKTEQTVIPATLPAIWQEVQTHEAELGRNIAAKQLDHVHETAFQIRDLVNALPDKSPELDAEKLGKLKANAKFVASLAGRLDESGDAKDQAATEANFKKFQQILKTIAGLYPPEMLKG